MDELECLEALDGKGLDVLPEMSRILYTTYSLVGMHFHAFPRKPNNHRFASRLGD